MADLFSSLQLRDVSIRNRIAISAMCMYSAHEGEASDFHLAHYGRFGLGGAGLVMIEATAVLPEGRISHGDLGLWSDRHIEPLARIVRLLKSQGATVGIQLCHSGRKANRQRPWHGNGPVGDEDQTLRGEATWPIKAPSAIAFGREYQVPTETTYRDMADIREAFVAAVERANLAGFDIVELHAAHGFLLHSFMSPLTNLRSDAYSGSFEGRHRYALEVVGDMRAAWPRERPMFVRVSAQDGVEGGRTLADTVAFAQALKAAGVDVIDCSSGGLAGHSASTSRDAPSYGFQIPYAQAVRSEADIATMAVGLITEPELANAAIAEGRTDLVAIGRQALFDPNWPLHAEAALGVADDSNPYASWPVQYGWWLNGRHKTLASLRSSPPEPGRLPERNTL
ncbi:MAG: NADH:flavin oxidoreductase/NADH oxidase [Alcaligenaceae bacterium]|nr:NADH:flavin oxidoreductase/NADH oxidase [Alcaligenaceae bacterium]